MRHLELVFRPDVENGDGPLLHTPNEFLMRYGPHAVALMEVTCNDLIDFGDVSLTRAPQRRQQINDGIVAEPANQKLSVLSRMHQTGGPEPLQVL